jgi:hypothetical protein
MQHLDAAFQHAANIMMAEDAASGMRVSSNCKGSKTNAALKAM